MTPDAAHRRHPDAADLHDEGIVAAKEIRQRHPGVAVLVLSQYTESAYAMELIEENPVGTGYLFKDGVTAGATLVDALRRLAAGECVVDPTIVRRMLARARRPDPLEALTPGSARCSPRWPRASRTASWR